MDEDRERRQLQQRLEQARRLAQETNDRLTSERLTNLVNELTEQLRKVEMRKRSLGWLSPR
jgi:hypothetical protein